MFMPKRMGAKEGLCPPYLHSIFNRIKIFMEDLLSPVRQSLLQVALFMSCWLRPVVLRSIMLMLLFLDLSMNRRFTAEDL